MTRTVLLLLSFLILSNAHVPRVAARREAAQRGGGRDIAVPRGTLADVKGIRRVALLVSRALVVDARDPALVALEDYKHALAGTPPRQHDAAARRVATRLNKYIRKYRSATAAEDFTEADLILVFKVTGQRASALPGDPFIWGKMFVIALGNDRAPRVVWESEGEHSTPEDATGDFLKALRAARGER